RLCHHLSFPSFPTRRSSDLGDLTCADQNIIDFLGFEVDDLFGGRIPFHTAAGLQRERAHVRGDSLLESFFDAATGFASVSDAAQDRKSTRLNSSHVKISYAV